ncbi:MAG: hypothetical protein GY729_08125 [Desulfobacteraceae bacterium]|nr:hypothetical protein [Desulfobacteraceae bacterium]
MTKILKTIIKVWPAFLLILLIQGCASYQGQVSDHFDGNKFYNPEPDHTFFEHIKWMWEMETVEWPDWIEDSRQPAPPEQVKNKALRVTYVNHATVLIQMDGINILTDPIWSNKAGPLSWFGAGRIRAPGIKIKDLPEIHLILISHDHYDHLDIPSLKLIVNKHQPIIIAGLGVRQRLSSINARQVVELDWWEDYDFSKEIKVTFVPARHNSGRGFFDSNKTLWGGFVVQGNAGNLIFMGDTALGEFAGKIQKKYDGFRLAILPVGSYKKRWFMKNQHMNPDDAVRFHKMIKAKKSMGIHFATFKEHPEQTVDAHEKDLALAIKTHGLPTSDFWILKFGEGRDVPQ